MKKKEPRKKTVGQLASELAQKESEAENPIDQTQESLSDYEKNVIEAANEGAKIFDDLFYIVVLFKTEPLMPNVTRNYFFSRISCPTPDYDQAVYKVKPKAREIDFLWAIPDKKTCEFMRDNKSHIPPEEYQLLNFVLSFYDGTLLQACKKMNNETQDTGQLIF